MIFGRLRADEPGWAGEWALWAGACKHPLMGRGLPGCQDALDPQPPHTARDHFVEAPLSERFQEGLEDGATSQLFDPLSFC